MGVCIAVLPTLHEEVNVENVNSAVNTAVDTVSSCNYLTLSHIKGLFIEHEVLGKGRTSSVRRVTKKSVGKDYVLKQMVRTNNYSKLFENEIKFISSLVHPNIINMEGGYYDDDNYYLCTELCSGGRLLDKVKKGVLSENKAIKVIKSILNAIKFCHDQNIVHRDIKLGNIMLDKKGDDGKIVVIDWGSAIKLNPHQLYSKIVGTLHYMGPECLKIRKASHLKKSDMFAIGVVAYSLLTGCFPFHIRTRNDVRRQSKVNIKWNVKVSADAKNFIESLLDENVSKRLSADEALSHSWIA
jgi:serine/threonine protein kinase